MYDPEEQKKKNHQSIIEKNNSAFHVNRTLKITGNKTNSTGLRRGIKSVKEKIYKTVHLKVHMKITK